MKILLILFSIAIAESSRHYAQKLCRTENDCDRDQCCLEAQTRIPGFNGICSNPTEQGEMCDSDSFNKTPDGRYRKACPCDKDLTCKQGIAEGEYTCQP